VKCSAILLGLSALAVAACGGGKGDDSNPPPAPDAPLDDSNPELRQGGDTTVMDRTQAAFLHPSPNLTTADAETYQAGLGPFDFHWAAPQLGPLYNNDSCFGCHGSNGRGETQIGGGALFSQALVRCSLATGTPAQPGGDVPVPAFGLQLQDHANVGLPEVDVALSWMSHVEMFGDGTTIMLRQPVVAVTTPDGKPLDPSILTSFRAAPQLIGMGLLAAVPEASIAALADPDDTNGDGISGKMNMVWDAPLNMTVLGRFGLKANEGTLESQVSGAFFNDMGLTNPDAPDTNTPPNNDVPDNQFPAVITFVSAIAVPAAAPRDAAATHGRQLFDSFGCAKCHVATLTTGDYPALPEVANQTIHPYTDLLLHDMGTGLADNRPDFMASGSEWRTQPLWGLGIAQIIDATVGYLHDGRAQTLPEAILWHGGEAAAASMAFRAASQQDRADLISFLQTL
jgi:CxxC motif-containing protein (DUF1111 family)